MPRTNIWIAPSVTTTSISDVQPSIVVPVAQPTPI